MQHAQLVIQVLSFAVAFVACQPLHATDFVAEYEHWPEKHRIAGRVILGENVEATLRVFREIAIDSDDQAVVLSLDNEIALPSELQGFNSLTSKSFLDPSATSLDEDKSVILWHSPTNVDAATRSKIKEKLQSFIEDGGSVCCVSSAVAAASDNDEGFGLLFDTVVQLPQADAVGDGQNDTETHETLLALKLEPDAVVLLSRRKMLCYGDGGFQLCVNGTDRVKTIKPRQSRSMPITDWLLDLTQWRRIAMEESLDAFPPAVPDSPIVENGKLYIVGGGGMPKGLMEQFVEDAGGKDARLIYVPCTEDAEVPANSSMVRLWKRMGVASAVTLHTKDRVKANTDVSFYTPLKRATGIWFGGGRQWNFADSYYGTATHRQMIAVLNRGGVIGGSSAGASVQARYLARSTPIENFDIIAPGYERGGLGFLPGVAIDQHFTQRGRHPDQEQLVQTYPQLLGIGIDEATAIIVTGQQARVTGRGDVYFFDRRDKEPSEPTVKTKVSSGESFDLVERTKL